MIRVGIDNGAEGAIVALRGNGTVLLCELMPTMDIGVRRKGKVGTKRVLDHGALLCIFKELRARSSDVFAVLEQAQPFPKEGVATSFNAGSSYGAIQMALHCAGLPFEIIPPQRWQKAILSGVEGADTKMRAVLRARRSFPGLNLTPGNLRKPHTGIADAACMALYAEKLRSAAPLSLGKPALTPPPPPPPIRR